MTLMRDNLNAIKFASLKCTILWLLSVSELWEPSPQSTCGTYSST